MSPRDSLDFLEDMLTSLDDIAKFTAGLDVEDFKADRKTAQAVVRSLEVIGEAAKNVPEEVRLRHPGFPWRNLAGMRDKLIHQYFGVDLTIVWTTVQAELPGLRERLVAIIGAESHG